MIKNISFHELGRSDFNRIVKITCTHRKENRVYHKSLTHNHESQWWMTLGVFDQWWFWFISRIFPLGKTNDKIVFDPPSWDWYSKMFPKWLSVLFRVFLGLIVLCNLCKIILLKMTHFHFHPSILPSKWVIWTCSSL